MDKWEIKKHLRVLATRQKKLMKMNERIKMIQLGQSEKDKRRIYLTVTVLVEIGYNWVQLGKEYY